jgi:co-chaperonin GroES (HSP10)
VSVKESVLHRLVPNAVRYALQARNSWVLVRRVTAAEKHTAEGVVIPEGQGRSQRGIVVSVPPGIEDLQPGQLVIYTNFPMEIEDVEELTGDKDLQLVQSDEIYAIAKALPGRLVEGIDSAT